MGQWRKELAQWANDRMLFIVVFLFVAILSLLALTSPMLQRLPPSIRPPADTTNNCCPCK